MQTDQGSPAGNPFPAYEVSEHLCRQEYDCGGEEADCRDPGGVMASIVHASPMRGRAGLMLEPVRGYGTSR